MRKVQPAEPVGVGEVQSAALTHQGDQACRAAPGAGGDPEDDHVTPDATTDCRHSPCFSSVLWFGTSYTFTVKQSGIVRNLWQNWERGTCDVREDFLLESVGSISYGVPNLFKGHPAWQTMIKAGATRRTRRLVAPDCL